ncbi:MAG: UDP-N-acetylmuramate:L-alanyl-gamma-D-glutamyl-meso-diaminopimelate ligase, partial [Desulfatibacillaceae bacterium]|nr:UDP-N-acetylmuramate:L-alanyl-gamma-D-glutamyl-meso-diaminopimelate ligase [Desulfatibacillaceae bacterium]
VCGTGMGALAGMLMDEGFCVTGSDANVYPPMSTFLEEKGIKVINGYAAKNLDHNPDLVIIGNAVSKDNPEAVAVEQRGLYYCSFPQAMNRFFCDWRAPVLVTGTHGKTTTSALVAWILAAVGLDPSFMIGGILHNFKSNHKVGAGPHIVIEGDEYDTAFFDKRPKFVHYTPQHTILTSVEFDHADIYADFDAVKAAFSTLVQNLPEQSLLVACGDDPVVMETAKKARCWVATYGSNPGNAWQLASYKTEPPWSHFEVKLRGQAFASFKTKLMGDYNLKNALAAIAVAHDLRIPEEGIAAALETFEGVARRQTVRGIVNGITLMDDFAHHPTAVKETLKGVKPFFPKGRVIAIFEPRTNTSRRNIFQDVYPKAFEQADIIIAAKPPLQEKIPFEQRFSSSKLVDDLMKQGKKAYYLESADQIAGFAASIARPGDLILVMSNGGFDNIHQKILKALDGLYENSKVVQD